MTTTITTLDALLKDFVVDEIVDQINQETMALQLFEKGSFDWNGRLVHIAIHTARNTGVAWNATGVLPPAGTQGWDALIVRAEKLYGRGQLDGDAIAALGKGGANSLVNHVQAEMDTLKEDVKSLADQSLVSGGGVIGFMSEQGFVGGAAQTWLFDGDFAKLAGIIAGTFYPGVAAANPVCQLVRFSDKEIHPTQVTITAVDPSDGTITIGALDTTNNAPGWNGAGTGLTVGDIYAVQMLNPAAILAEVGNEPKGIYSNLGLVAPFGVSAATESTMRANGFTLVAEGAGGAPPNTRVALDLDLHLQRAIDDAYEASGKDIDCFLTGVRQRSQYASLVSGTVQADFANRAKVGGANAGFKTSGGGGLSYGGYDIKVSRHIGSGHWMAIKTDAWKMAELEPVGFMDLDGSILSRVAGADAYEFTVRWYVNFVCCQPNANTIFTGVNV